MGLGCIKFRSTGVWRVWWLPAKPLGPKGSWGRSYEIEGLLASGEGLRGEYFKAFMAASPKP